MLLNYKHIVTLIVLFIGLQTPIKQQQVVYSLITSKAQYAAGQDIALRFKSNVSTNTKVMLYCSNSYGAVVLQPEVLNNTLNYQLPPIFTKKTGVVNWKLLNTKSTLTGQFLIVPMQKAKTIETYVGPPVITAGKSNYAMLVAIPTDNFDNPLADGTEVIVNTQFYNTKTSKTNIVSNGYVANTVYSYNTTGRVLIGLRSGSSSTKEFDIGILPAKPTTFKISAKRVHEFADGHQIITFTTSKIKDIFNNTVSDGTFITFVITDTDGHKSKTFGTTINGVATAQILHPDHKTTWRIQGFINGMASTNVLRLDYKQAIKDFQVYLKNNNRTIEISQLESFMSQYIPDGLHVILELYKDDVLQHKIIQQSKNATTTFTLSPNRYPSGTYTIKISAAGIIKTFNTITL